MLLETGIDHSWTTLAPIKWFCAYSWRVAVRPRDPGSFVGSGQRPFRFVDAPYGHFFADPFVIEEGGRTFVFAEDYSYFARSGRLACVELDAFGRVLQTRTILQRPYHLSYPQVFCVAGTYYMIPETASANRVELYRAVDFPWQWKLDRILLNGVRLYDPTHAIIDGKHWIFAGGCSNRNGRYHDELHLFHAPSIHDKFRPHRGNPVKTDLASARPAGALRVVGHRLIRPAQDCRGWYGRGLTFMAVDFLDEKSYGESPVLRVPDTWVPGNHVGIHTFNASEHFEVIDVCYYGLKMAAFAGRARSLAKAARSNSIPEPVPPRRSSTAS
jgi:hypothetical protein